MLLTQLAAALRGGVIRVLHGDTRAVSGVELLDFPEAAEATTPGQVLLAVGLNVEDRDAMDEALRTAAKTACALAVKCPDGAAPQLTAHARDAGVPRDRRAISLHATDSGERNEPAALPARPLPARPPRLPRGGAAHPREELSR